MRLSGEALRAKTLEAAERQLAATRQVVGVRTGGDGDTVGKDES